MKAKNFRWSRVFTYFAQRSVLHEGKQPFLSDFIFLKDIEDLEGELFQILLILIDEVFYFLKVVLSSNRYDEPSKDWS